MIDLNKLKAAAEAAKAYQPDAIKAHSFGCFDEEGVFYELGNVCARIYERDENSDGSFADDALLNHIIAASPDAVLELITMASAAAPQVAADERVAFDEWSKPIPYVLFSDYAWQAWQARAASQAAPVQAQEPVVACGCNGVGGCVSSVKLSAGEFCKASCFSAAEQMAFRAPVQPVAVPDGWPTDEMVVRGAEQLHDCLRSAGVEHDFDANLQGTEIQQDIAESVFKSMIDLAAPAAQGDAIRKVEVEDQGPLGVVTKTTYALANAKEAKDAERYRWLRNDAGEWYIGPDWYPDGPDAIGYADHHGEDLDTAIDAAIAAKAAL